MRTASTGPPQALIAETGKRLGKQGNGGRSSVASGGGQEDSRAGDGAKQAAAAAAAAVAGQEEERTSRWSLPMSRRTTLMPAMAAPFVATVLADATWGIADWASSDLDASRG